MLDEGEVPPTRYAGFKELDESLPWEPIIEPGGRYYFTRNQSTIVAFAVGQKAGLGSGFHVGTDSPCPHRQPLPQAEAYLQEQQGKKRSGSRGPDGRLTLHSFAAGVHQRRRRDLWWWPLGHVVRP